MLFFKNKEEQTSAPAPLRHTDCFEMEQVTKSFLQKSCPLTLISFSPAIIHEMWVPPTRRSLALPRALLASHLSPSVTTQQPGAAGISQVKLTAITHLSIWTMLAKISPLILAALNEHWDEDLFPNWNELLNYFCQPSPTTPTGNISEARRMLQRATTASTAKE